MTVITNRKDDGLSEAIKNLTNMIEELIVSSEVLNTTNESLTEAINELLDKYGED